MTDLLDETLIELQEVADWLKVELQTVRNWTDRDARERRGLPWLEADKIGGVIRTSREAVKRFRSAGKPAPIAQPSQQQRLDAQHHADTMRALKERHGMKDHTDAKATRSRRRTA